MNKQRTYRRKIIAIFIENILRARAKGRIFQILTAYVDHVTDRRVDHVTGVNIVFYKLSNLSQSSLLVKHCLKQALRSQEISIDVFRKNRSKSDTEESVRNTPVSIISYVSTTGENNLR